MMKEEDFKSFSDYHLKEIKRLQKRTSEVRKAEEMGYIKNFEKKRENVVY